MKNTAIIIPSRLEAKRFPRKPLAEIKGLPMIIHVLNRAKEAKVGEVFVATPDKEIFTVHEYKYDTVATRLRELSFLNSGIKILLTDERELDENNEQKSDEFYSEGGLVEFVNYLDGSREK